MRSKNSFLIFILIFIAASGLEAASQASQPKMKKNVPQAGSAAIKKPSRRQVLAQKNFVLQVVKSAVALSQPDPQDRLRVLNSAVNVTLAIAPIYAARLAKEGTRIETELIAVGQKPVVSLIASGRADCSTVKTFVDDLFPKSVVMAEQALIGAVTKCPKMTLETLKNKVDAAMEQGIIAPRLTMAIMDRLGPQSPWTQDRFVKMFSMLPSDVEKEETMSEAPNFAAMYAGMADKLNKDIARTTGLNLLEWLGKLESSGLRSMAINITTSGMKAALGEEKYHEALAGNVMARQSAETQVVPAEIPTEQEESASVLRAMGGSGSEQQETLRQLPPSLRAREAAANGFARGTSGDLKSAEVFFDMAFAAADETWSQRNTTNRAAEVIEEVSEAAAHVDAVNALTRAQRLQDPTAQAIGMIAVARVVAGRDTR